MSSRPRIVATTPIYEGWNKLDVVTVEATDRHGELHRRDREVIDHGDAGVVLAVDPERRVAIMVRQWRAPLIAAGLDPFLLEACAGLLDPGESPEEATRREAEEEIGLEVRELRYVGSVLPSAGTLTERMHLHIAEVSSEDRIEGGGGNAHEGEDIEVVEVPLAQLFAMARRGAIEDAKTLILVQRLMIEEMEAAQPS
jgi:nudix-type nucleoside diphosphatase (YffH/AdpP family)